MAEALPTDHHGVLLGALAQGLNNSHYSKAVFTRRRVVQLLGSLTVSFSAQLGRRHLSRLVATIVAHMDDADSTVCAEPTLIVVLGFSATESRS
jgi:hypothetical protein